MQVCNVLCNLDDLFFLPISEPPVELEIEVGIVVQISIADWERNCLCHLFHVFMVEGA